MVRAKRFGIAVGQGCLKLTRTARFSNGRGGQSCPPRVKACAPGARRTDTLHRCGSLMQACHRSWRASPRRGCGGAPVRLPERVHRRYSGGTPEVHRRIPSASGVLPVYLRCTQREGPENRAVRSEMNPKSEGLPKVYPFGKASTTKPKPLPAKPMAIGVKPASSSNCWPRVGGAREDS